MKAAAILIGAGFVGKAHVEALRRLGVEIRGVLGSTPERGEESRAELGLPRAYASIEEAAAD
ncbi:MAG: gfo/Idh/MocA family oxidoreductase, partial [Candidatus Acidiferrum sp.]